MKKLILNGFVSLLLLVPSVIQGQSLWRDGQGSNYSDPVAVAPGDILTIEVDESAQGQTESEREREKTVEMGGQANAGAAGATVFHEVASWIPLFGPAISGESTYESEREGDAFGSLNTTMSVRVETVRDDGILELHGQRKVKIDDEVQTLKFRGLARKQDVRPDNTIPSNKIANAEIFYEGRLGLTQGEPRGLLDSTYLFVKNTLFY